MTAPFRPARPLAAFAAFAAVTFAACASAGGGREAPGAIAAPSAGQPTQATTIVAGRTSYSVTATNAAPGSAERAIAVPPDTAFYALVEAYQGLGMTPNTVVSSTRTVGVREARYRQVLGKRRLSDFLSCGTDAAGLPLADQYRVTLTALSRVSPGVSGGSVVATQVSATAQSIAQSTDPVRCESNGRLEDAVNAAAMMRTAR